MESRANAWDRCSRYDGTSRPVVDELEEAGIPREDIVPLHTGYAVG